MNGSLSLPIYRLCIYLSICTESKKEVKNEVGRKRNRQNANRRKNRNKKVHGNGNNNNAKQTGNSSQKDGKKTMKEGDTKQHNKAPKNLKPGKPNASIAARKDGDGKRQKECKLRNKCKKASGQCKKEDCVNSVKNGCGKKSGCTCCLKDSKLELCLPADFSSCFHSYFSPVLTFLFMLRIFVTSFRVLVFSFLLSLILVFVSYDIVNLFITSHVTFYVLLLFSIHTINLPHVPLLPFI